MCVCVCVRSCASRDSLFHALITCVCVSVLQSSDIIPEAASVLEYLPSRVEPRGRADFPVIVIEGLDATG